MGVAVYPRLNELLRAKNLTVAELERQIEQQFGVQVDPKTLYRLTYPERVQRADLEIAGAAAAVLGVSLGDLFDVQAIPVRDATGSGNELTSAESQRLAELFERQARQALPPVDREELEGLVAEYGRRLHERLLGELAQQRGIPLEQARSESQAQLDEAHRWWQTFDADPERRRALASRVKQRRSRPSE
ncbi:MAG TPA: helix-turn-helix transcriptional regulator [Chloroflexota bacterium]|jgi:transposase